MIGLEDRLRTVEGVASIRVELGEEGVDAIKVEVVPGADEAGVLEEIRKVLVSYGLRSRRPGWRLGTKRSPAIIAEVAGAAGETPAPQERPAEVESPAEVEIPAPADAGADDLPRVTVHQGGRGLVISITAGQRSAEASSDISPIGAAEAMARVVAEFHGLSRPDRVAVVMHELDGERVVTLLARRGDRSVVAAEPARPLLHDALYLATERVLRDLEG
jgi:hypothetical protein